MLYAMAYEDSKTKTNPATKKEFNKIYKQLLRYAIYGSLAMTIVVTIVLVRDQTHDTRSRASDPKSTQLTLVNEEKNPPVIPDCYDATVSHKQTLNGTIVRNTPYVHSIPFCETALNTGFIVSLDSTTLPEVTIVSPLGTEHTASRVSSDIINGKTYYSVKGCIITPSDVAIEPGVWVIQIENTETQFADVTLEVLTGGSATQWQSAYCTRE
jgi:hypothetical protein